MRNQKNLGTSTRSLRDTTSASQQSTARVSNICAIAMENCRAAATPNMVSSPACSSQSVVAVAGGAEESACALVVATISSLLYRRSKQTLGGLNDVARRDSRQAAKVARF